MRIEPAVSVPSASGASPLATATAEPPLDPPATRSGAHGLRVGDAASLVVVIPQPNSWVVVLPRRTAPASFSRATATASPAGTRPAQMRDPHAVGTPAVSRRSFAT